MSRDEFWMKVDQDALQLELQAADLERNAREKLDTALREAAELRSKAARIRKLLSDHNELRKMKA